MNTRGAVLLAAILTPPFALLGGVTQRDRAEDTAEKASLGLRVLASLLPMLLAAVIPALAQAETVEGQPTGVPPGSTQDRTVTVTFELMVEGEPPEAATFFGYLGYEPVPIQLTDPDGDGVYTGSTPEGLVPAGDTQPAFILQGTGTRESQVVGTSPGDPTRLLKDFGEVTLEEDTTLSAHISPGQSSNALTLHDSRSGYEASSPTPGFSRGQPIAQYTS